MGVQLVVGVGGDSGGEAAAHFAARVASLTGGSVVLVFGYVCLAWIFFRAETLGQAMDVLKAMFAPQVVSSWLALDLERYPIAAAILAYCIYRLVEDNLGKITSIIPAGVRRVLAPLPPARVAIYVAVFIMALGLAPTSSSPFIYFAF